MTDRLQDSIDAVLGIDEAVVADRIVQFMRSAVQKDLRKRGLVIGISGGIDSAVCACLAVQAVGKDRVFGLLMPERDSSPESTTKGRSVAEMLGIQYRVEDIAPILEASGCYRWRDDAIRSVFPAYQSDWKSKIAISGATQGTFNHFRLIVQDPAGAMQEQRLGLKEYLQIVAATNFKQRVRKMIEYFDADRLNYAVIGTPNRLEYDQGFFVKNGDGSADLKPIAHLYKSQVYALARHLGVPEAIQISAPSTDTYSLSQGQDEFYFALPYREMDLALWHYNAGQPAQVLCDLLDVTLEAAQGIYRDIESKRRTTAPLHWAPLLAEDVRTSHRTPDTAH